MSEAIARPRPLTFGAFHLGVDGLKVRGKAELSDFAAALRTVTLLEECSPFWKADLLAYADRRKDWEGALDALIDSEQFTQASIYEYKRVAKAIPPENRVEGVSFGHHQAVAALPSVDQQHLLKQAKREHLSVVELKREARKLKARKILKGQDATLAKLHNELADHAWEAASACRDIPKDDGKHAVAAIRTARKALDACEAAAERLRKAQGKK